MYFIRPPFLYRWLFPRALFRTDRRDRTVHLTFDDGPHPEATPFVLDTLREEGVTATFFLLGRNAEKYPELTDRIRQEGHTVANHGHGHLNGWQTGTDAYMENFLKAEALLGDRLFRPPYGKLTPAQYHRLLPRTTIVMWDVLSGDFDPSIGPEKCIGNVLENVRDGSIIVMHDSGKALPNLRNSLKEVICSIKGLGYGFRNL